MNNKLNEAKAYVELHKSDVLSGSGFNNVNNALNILESVPYLKKDREEKLILLKALLKKYSDEYDRNISMLKNEIERLQINGGMSNIKYFSKYN
jgi:hypothetical protein